MDKHLIGIIINTVICLALAAANGFMIFILVLSLIKPSLFTELSGLIITISVMIAVIADVVGIPIALAVHEKLIKQK